MFNSIVIAILFSSVVMPVTVFELICKCFAVKKTGNPWWTQLIPLYSYYILFKTGKKPKLFWLYVPFHILTYYLLLMRGLFWIVSTTVHVILAGTMTYELVGLIGNDGAGWLPIVVVMLMISIAALTLSVILCESIAKAFGKGSWFGIGLLLVPVVFWAIIAFDSSVQYARDDIQTDEGGYYTA